MKRRAPPTRRSPGNNPHADRPNFTFEDYVQMVRDGEAAFSLSEACRLLGWSRSRAYRAMTLASFSDEEFETLMNELEAAGRRLTVTNLAAEIRRRTGQARSFEERCPHCGEVLRTRRR